VTLYRVRGSCIALNTPNSYNNLGGNNRAYNPSLDIYIFKRLQPNIVNRTIRR
jgi:hypothetical protein